MTDLASLSPLFLIAGIGLTLFALYLTLRNPRSSFSHLTWVGGLSLLGVNLWILLAPAMPTPPTEEISQNPIPGTAESIAQGQALYLGNCARCHGESMTGDGPEAASFAPPPANLWEHIPHHEDGIHFVLLTQGKGNMPAFASTLSETERWHLINYLRDATKPEKMGEMEEMDH